MFIRCFNLVFISRSNLRLATFFSAMSFVLAKLCWRFTHVQAAYIVCIAQLSAPVPTEQPAKLVGSLWFLLHLHCNPLPPQTSSVPQQSHRLSMAQSINYEQCAQLFKKCDQLMPNAVVFVHKLLQLQLNFVLQFCFLWHICCCRA